MPKPKRQHFIPRLHLKHFAGQQPPGQVWTYDAETGDARSAIPDETAIETHFYSFEGVDGKMDTRIEEFLSKAESKAEPVYSDLLKGIIPANSTQARADFATFIALMYTRTPAMRRMHGEFIGREMQIMSYVYAQNEQAFEALSRRIQEAGGPVFTAEEKKRIREGFIDPSGFIMQIPKEKTLLALPLADRLAPLFFKMKWSLMSAANGFFITSDNPVVREVDPKSVHRVYGDSGFTNKTAEITFPLSPKMLLLMSWNPAPPKASLDRKLVQLTNEARAAYSERYLYAHIQHKRVQQLATKYKSSRPGIIISGFGPKKFAEVKVVRRLRK